MMMYVILCMSIHMMLTFCKKKGHMKKDCSKFKAWMSKRGLTGIHKPEEAKQG